MARPEKTQAVEEITGRFKEADAVLLTEYRGLSVTAMADVRRALSKADADYKVLKNTLTRIAVRKVGLDELVGMLEGPVAIAFVKGDAAAAAKALDDAAKQFPVLQVKGGVLSGRIIDADQAKALAALEPREVQLGKIVMMVNSPLQQTANAIGALFRDLGAMLAQVAQKKESGELPGGGASAAGAAHAAGGQGDPPVEEETLENPAAGPGPEAEAGGDSPQATDDTETTDQSAEGKEE